MKYAIALVLIMAGTALADNYYIKVTWNQNDVPLVIRYSHMTFLCEATEFETAFNDYQAECTGWMPFEEAESIHFLNMPLTSRWHGFVIPRTRRVYGYNGVWYLVTPDFAFRIMIPASVDDCTVHTRLRWRIDPNQN